MSALGLQDWLAILLVLLALGYLVARQVRARKRASACGDCPGCAPSSAPPAPEPLIRIGEGRPRPN